MNNNAVQIYAGRGKDRGRDIDWDVRRNDAQQEVSIAVLVNGNAFRNTALLHAGMLRCVVGVLEEDWLVCPPRQINATTPECWMDLAGKSEQLERISAFLPMKAGVIAPPNFRPCMPLGNANFGLIHLLGGHTRNMRALIGDNNQAQHTDDEGYRTVQGIQMGIEECLCIRELLEIRYDFGSKWLFYGKAGALLVTQLRRGILWITTFYLRDQSPKDTDQIYWRRKKK